MLFDLNFDGKTTFSERMIGNIIIQQNLKSQNRRTLKKKLDNDSEEESCCADGTVESEEDSLRKLWRDAAIKDMDEFSSRYDLDYAAGLTYYFIKKAIPEERASDDDILDWIIEYVSRHGGFTTRGYIKKVADNVRRAYEAI